MLPIEATGVLSSLAGIVEIAKDTFGGDGRVPLTVMNAFCGSRLSPARPNMQGLGTRGRVSEPPAATHSPPMGFR